MITDVFRCSSFIVAFFGGVAFVETTERDLRSTTCPIFSVHGNRHRVQVDHTFYTRCI